MVLTKNILLGYIVCGVVNVCKTLELFPPENREGCLVSRTACVVTAYCNLYYDVNLENSDQATGCEDKIRLGRTNYLPIDVVFKEGTLKPYRYENDQYRIEYDSDQNKNYFLSPNLLIKSIDFSNNGYEITPDLTNFINLKQFNISHNQLAVAQLCDSVDFDSLEEIDMSFNFIETIEVLETQKAYIGLKILNLSHNLISSIPEALFYNFKNLAHLDLSNNRITNLNMFTFMGLKRILTLNLGHNLIKSLDLSIAKLKTVEQLYLNNNEITKLSYADLHSLTQLKYMDLSTNKINNIESQLFNNFSYLNFINLKNNNLKFIDKEMFSNIKELEYIDLSHNEITNLPKRLFNGNHIKNFCITGNNVQGDLSKGMFEGLHLVKNLDMSYQGITAIGDNAFFGIENISELLLNNNAVKTVSNKSFNLLTKLIRLELSHNYISNFTLDLENLISLEFLSLAYNELTFINKNHFNFSNKLEFLDLSNNKIITIEQYSFEFQEYLQVLLIDNNQLQGKLAQNTFNGLHALPSLDLAYSSLTITSNKSFDGMTHLLKINISHSALRELSFNTFINTGKLEILDLSYNQLTQFHLNTTDLENLKTLILQNNLLKTLSDGFDRDLKRLQILDLSHNNLLTIRDKVLSNQGHLEYLDLSHNLNLVIDTNMINTIKNLKTLKLSSTRAKNATFVRNNNSILSELEISNCSIENISAWNFSELKHLSSLVLRNNEVRKLLSAAFTNMSSLYSLDMSYNKIEYLQPGVFKDCHYLHIFNISHNLLIDVNYGVFRGLSSLSVLDISYNLIENLKDEQFYNIRSLSELIVDHNKISDVTIEEFLSLHLRKLSIGGNPIPCKALIRLKKEHNYMEITATVLEYGIHNYYGVTCNGEMGQENYTENKNMYTITPDNNLGVLLDIRNILSKIQNNTIQRDEVNNLTKVLVDLQTNSFATGEFKNMINNLNNLRNNTVHKNESGNLNEIKKIGDDINSSIKEVTLKTNSLLERILNILMTKKSLVTSDIAPNSFNNSIIYDTSYLNRLEDLENKFIIEKDKLVSEFDNKILELSKRVEVKEPEVAGENNIRNPTFTEVCVALILLILLCCIVFFIYKSNFSKMGSLTLSTRRITDDIENSNL